MEIRHLRYFCVLAEQLHFTKAAVLLNVAQPALSHQFRQRNTNWARNWSSAPTARILEQIDHQELGKGPRIVTENGSLGMVDTQIRREAGPFE